MSGYVCCDQREVSIESDGSGLASSGFEWRVLVVATLLSSPRENETSEKK